MKICEFKQDSRLIVTIDGRLDASWSDYFRDTILKLIRSGEHHITIVADKLSFLSSMGIRSLLLVYKELHAVNGTFEIANSSGMVKSTLEQSGLGDWLTNEIIDSDRLEESSQSNEQSEIEFFDLNKEAFLNLKAIEAWSPWKIVQQDKCENISFTEKSFGLGIGGSGNNYDESKDHFGEFLTIAGHVALQPPDERGRPDYLIREKEFTPSLNCIQASICTGEFSKSLRFRETAAKSFYKISELIETMLQSSGSFQIGWAVIGEIEGIVGASLIKSPSNLKNEDSIGYPEIKEWISFCGERLFSGEQALITGIAERNEDGTISAHSHAAVFPYQFLPNGLIDLYETATKIFNVSPPKAIIHLLNDKRYGNGIGESALRNGAAWFGPIRTNKEEA